MPVEVEVHTVPHFKAPINGKIDILGPECGKVEFPFGVPNFSTG